jgi:hypothetical protein
MTGWALIEERQAELVGDGAGNVVLDVGLVAEALAAEITPLGGLYLLNPSVSEGSYLSTEKTRESEKTASQARVHAGDTPANRHFSAVTRAGIA